MHDEVLGWQVEHLHDAGQLLHLVLAGEQRKARVKLRQNAACGEQTAHGELGIYNGGEAVLRELCS